ncbi:hypothetical protein LTR78_010120 [Recurvomyces mirabilis]|uniref:Ankyrin repeat protein n=1 Tax=Recurvomyces mirabilis TaxID=574656 RepID=A0AAE0TSN8_9PEZI|nr:hypothetical protein LTR78_010120 [Recurvomyces mirabilis]KAK5150054.1 hypothetical protein LTS14_010419 [Recurvomyces mirabilis]
MTEEIAAALSNGDGYAIGSNVADWDVDGTTTSPAECAARNGLQDVAMALLQDQADVNATDENGRTALHGAAGLGHVAVVRLLLDSHADAGAKDVNGCTAREFATRRHHSDIESLLCDHLELEVKDSEPF